MGQMIALMKLKLLHKMIQKSRLVAAKLRFLMCQAIGGRSRSIDMNANTGTATAPGVRGEIDVAIVVAIQICRYIMLMDSDRGILVI